MKKRSFLEIVKNRETTYSFLDKKVPSAHLKKILEAGRWSPSSHNSQNWTFIVIRNEKTIDDLLETCYYGGFYEHPPVIIAFVNEPIYMNLKGLQKAGAKEYAEYHQYLNISIPAVTMVYAAESLGLSTCILSPSRKPAAKILKTKEKEVVLLIGLGYAKKGYRKPRSRKPLKTIVRFESYGN